MCTTDKSSDLMTLVEAASTLMDSSASAATKKNIVDTNEPVQDAVAPTVDKTLGFVEQLMQVLDDETYSNVITWMPDGKAFTIVNHRQFTKVEMPKLFNIRNMSSFVRKLTRFGFTRIHDKQTMNSDIFAHKDFQRGNRQKASEIKYAPAARPVCSTSLVSQAAKPSLAKPVALASTITPQVSSEQGVPSSFGGQSSSPTIPRPCHLPKFSGRGSIKSEPYVGQSLMDWSSDTSVAYSTSGSSSTAPLRATTKEPVGAAIKNLLREREALRHGARANTMAILALVQEQQKLQRSGQEFTTQSTPSSLFSYSADRRRVPTVEEKGIPAFPFEQQYSSQSFATSLSHALFVQANRHHLQKTFGPCQPQFL